MFLESQPLPTSISADAPNGAVLPQDPAQQGRSPDVPAQPDATLDPYYRYHTALTLPLPDAVFD